MKNIFLVSIIFLYLLSCQQEKELHIYHNYDEALQLAQQNDKEIFVFFNSYGLIGVRTMDSFLLDAKVKKLLKKYIVVELFCDDYLKKDSTQTYGKYNAELQEKITGQFYQPMFCFLNKNGNLLKEPFGYCSKKEEFINFLER